MIAAKARFSAARKVQKVVGYRLPEFVFHGSFLEVISSAVDYDLLDPAIRTQLLNIFRDFCSCKCRNSPQCGCAERAFARMILELRMDGLDHREISDLLLDEYGISIYPADLLGFLEESVHLLEAAKEIAVLEGDAGMEKQMKGVIQNISQ